MFREIPLNVHLLEFDAVTSDSRNVNGIDTITGDAQHPLSRLMLRTVLESLDANPALMPLTVHRLGHRLLPGEHPDSAGACVTHDRGVLVVAQHPGGCGVDVEDADPRLLTDVAYRFCAPDDGARAGLRELWAMKESVAKSLGLGLTADLRTIIGDPARRCTPMIWHSAPPGRIATVVAAGGWHLALIMAADLSPRIVERYWRVDRDGSPCETGSGSQLAALVGLQDRDGGDENVRRHAA
jgi:hypothetical protein